MIMSVLDTTIVNVALESLSKDLHTASTTSSGWYSAYLLALAAVIPVSAWAIRRYSAYRVYMVGLVCLHGGSALCGWRPSRRELIAFRVLQGVGGGLLAPTGLTSWSTRPDGRPAEGDEHDRGTNRARSRCSGRHSAGSCCNRSAGTPSS